MHLIEQIDRDISSDDDSAPPNYQKIFTRLDAKIDGSCSLVLLGGNGDLLAYRDKTGNRPLFFVEHNDVLCIASETHGFQEIGLEDDYEQKITEIQPGQIIHYNQAEDTITTHQIAEPDPHFCIIETLYFMHNHSRYDNRSIEEIRQEIGLAMGEQMRARFQNVDDVVVAAIPNSAIPGAIGFSKATNIEQVEALTRQRPADETRSFIDENPEKIVTKKFTINADQVHGKKIILYDDTMIRGTTARILVGKIREAGATEVHFVLGAPPVIGTCNYGIKIAGMGELLTYQAAQDLVESGQSFELSLIHI